MVSVKLYLPSIDKDGDSVSPAEASLLLTLIVNKAKKVSLMNGQFFGKTSDNRLMDGQILEILMVVEEEEVEALVERIHDEMTGALQQELVYMEVDGKPSIR